MPVGPHAAYIRAILDRTRRLREARGWSQAQMALALGVPLETYKKYETRTPIPIHLIERFATITGSEVGYIVTGKQRLPGARANRAEATGTDG